MLYVNLQADAALTYLLASFSIQKQNIIKSQQQWPLKRTQLDSFFTYLSAQFNQQSSERLRQ